MEHTLHFILLLFTLNIINVKCSFNIFPYCNYIDDTDSVRIKCFGDQYAGHSRCLEDFSSGDSNEYGRSRVKRLEIIYASICDNKETAALDGFFWNIRELDYSNANTPTLHSNLRFRYLEKFNAAHNEIGALSPSIFEGQLSLQEIDFSYNYISIIHEGTFDQNLNLSVIYLAHNALQSVDRNTVSSLIELRTLDLSFNQIVAIDRDAFRNNQKLETLNLENNPLSRFDCHIFSPLRSLKSIGVSIEHFIEMDMSCAEWSLSPASEDGFDLHLSNTNNEFHLRKEHFMNFRRFNAAGKQLQNTTEVLNLLGSRLEALDLSSNLLAELKPSMFDKFPNLQSLRLSNTNLSFGESNPFYNQTKLKVLDVSNNDLSNVNFSVLSKTLGDLTEFSIGNGQVQNVPEILQLLSSSLESLDLSSNQLGKVKDSTFKRFTNLRFFNLSRTYVKNYGFTTFFHQNKLESLDVSQNDWNDADFSLFARKFNYLEVMNLEGNRLHTVKGLTPAIFPKLNSLGFSKNQFTCEYLATFLSDWPDLKMIHNPTKDTHIDGVDCILNFSNEDNLI